MFKRSINISVWDKQHLIAYFFRVFAAIERIDDRKLTGFAPAEQLRVRFASNFKGFLTLRALIFYQISVKLSLFPLCFYHLQSPCTTRTLAVAVRQWFCLPFLKAL